MRSCFGEPTPYSPDQDISSGCHPGSVPESCCKYDCSCFPHSASNAHTWLCDLVPDLSEHCRLDQQSLGHVQLLFQSLDLICFPHSGTWLFSSGLLLSLPWCCLSFGFSSACRGAPPMLLPNTDRSLQGFQGSLQQESDLNRLSPLWLSRDVPGSLVPASQGFRAGCNPLPWVEGP